MIKNMENKIFYYFNKNDTSNKLYDLWKNIYPHQYQDLYNFDLDNNVSADIQYCVPLKKNQIIVLNTKTLNFEIINLKAIILLLVMFGVKMYFNIMLNQ